MKIFIGPNQVIDEHSLFAAVERAQPIHTPFAERLIDFLHSFGSAVLSDSSSRDFPELVVMGRYFRRGSIRRNFLNSHYAKATRLPRGLCFHLAPSNVDTIFLYSSLISLLCGNVCMVRVSQSTSSQMDIAFTHLNRLLTGEFSDLASLLYIFTYPHDHRLTQRLSTMCHCRVLWGSDETIRDLRLVPLNPRANEVAFPNRFSGSVINAREFLSTSDCAEIIRKWIADIRFFEQGACSSPKVIYWVGKKEHINAARDKFESQALDLVRRHQFLSEPTSLMERFTYLTQLAASGKLLSSPGYLAGITFAKLADNLTISTRVEHPGHGVVLVEELEDIVDLPDRLNQLDQTLTHFGFSEGDLVGLCQNLPARAVDRIVPFGVALDFHHVWDGVDLVDVFSRFIQVEL